MLCNKKIVTVKILHSSKKYNSLILREIPLAVRLHYAGDIHNEDPT
jgi:hypothetical protein